MPIEMKRGHVIFATVLLVLTIVGLVVSGFAIVDYRSVIANYSNENAGLQKQVKTKALELTNLKDANAELAASNTELTGSNRDLSGQLAKARDARNKEHSKFINEHLLRQGADRTAREAVITAHKLGAASKKPTK
jgi:uncharacterized membrane protein YccC